MYVLFVWTRCFNKNILEGMLILEKAWSDLCVQIVSFYRRGHTGAQRGKVTCSRALSGWIRGEVLGWTRAFWLLGNGPWRALFARAAAVRGLGREGGLCFHCPPLSLASPEMLQNWWETVPGSSSHRPLPAHPPCPQTGSLGCSEKERALREGCVLQWGGDRCWGCFFLRMRLC